MKDNKLNKNILVELIEIAQKFKMKEFYFKNECLEVSIGFSNEIKYKDIDEISITEDLKNENLEEVIIKSEYVARIKLENGRGDFFVKVGDEIKKGTKIAEYEYLNVTLDLSSPCDGIITEILIKHNDIVDYNKSLVIVNSY